MEAVPGAKTSFDPRISLIFERHNLPNWRSPGFTTHDLTVEKEKQSDLPCAGGKIRVVVDKGIFFSRKKKVEPPMFFPFRKTCKSCKKRKRVKLPLRYYSSSRRIVKLISRECPLITCDSLPTFSKSGSKQQTQNLAVEAY